MKAISLFAGIGGFDLAARRCGVRTVAHSEISENALAIFRRHFPRSKALGSVVDVDTTKLVRCEIAFAGWPCQDLSVAGRRAGLAGSRSGLFAHVERIIAARLPRWFLLENVPGLLSSGDGRDMAHVVGALSDLGYGLAWRVFNLARFGVPQRRHRLFFVGCLGNLRHSAEVLFERDCLPWHSAPRQKKSPHVAGCVTASYGSNGPRVEDADNLVAGTIGARYGRNNSPDDADSMIAYAPKVAHTINGQGSRFGSGRDAQETFVAHAPEVYSMCDGQAIPQGTLRANAKSAGDGAPITVARRGVRKLMPIECERLQGFPDDWTRYRDDGEELSDCARYSLIGNAVPPPIAEWILRRLKKQNRFLTATT